MKLKLLTITAALVAANVNASEVAFSVGLQNTFGSTVEEGKGNSYTDEGLGLGVEHSIPMSDNASAFYGANAFVSKNVLSNKGPKSATIIAGGEFAVSEFMSGQMGVSCKAKSTGEADAKINYAPGYYLSVKQRLNDDFALKFSNNVSVLSGDEHSNASHDFSLGVTYSKQIEA